MNEYAQPPWFPQASGSAGTEHWGKEGEFMNDMILIIYTYSYTRILAHQDILDVRCTQHLQSIC